jgi:hypothetical protein
MKRIKLAYLLNHPNDIPLGSLVYMTKPENVDVKVLIMNFHHHDEYGWGGNPKVGKGKLLTPCIRDTDIADVKQVYPETDVFICNNYHDFRYHVEESDILCSRGKEFCIFRDFGKKCVALSMDRSYFNRMLDVMPYYENLKVFLQGENWLREDLCGNFNMSVAGNLQSYENIEKYKDNIKCIDILGHYRDILSRNSKQETRRSLGIPTDRKVGFVSFRKAEEDFSVYRSNDEFLQKTKNMMIEFRNKGYYILCRERLDKDNVAWDHRRGTSNLIEQVSDLIDMKIDGHDGFPSLIWRAMYASDILLCADTSGICSKEAFVCKTPIYMPYDEYFVNNKLKLNFQHHNPLNPVLRNMYDNKLIFNSFDEESLLNFNNKIDESYAAWYNTDVDLFWKEMLD